MTFAEGSRARCIIAEENTYGELGSPEPQFTQIPFITNGITLTKSLFEDPSIQSNRQRKFLRHGNKEVGGDIQVALSHQAFDDLFVGLLDADNDWDGSPSNELTVGTTNHSYQVEVGHEDISQYRLFTGLVVDTFNLEVNTDGVVTSTFGLVGKDLTTDTSSIDPDAASQPNKQPFVHFDGTFSEGGSESTIITSASFTIANNSTRNYALGDSSLKAITQGMIDVTGTIEAYFEDVSLVNKFINETGSSLTISLDDGNSNTLTFEFPNVKYTSNNVPVNDDGPVMITLGFTALYDNTEDTVVKVVRSA